MTAARDLLEYRAAAALELRRRQGLEKSARKTIIGFVCPEKGPLHAVQQDAGGRWSEVSAEPDVWLPAVMERVVTTPKRFVILIGGRGSAKSVGVGDICLIDAKDNGVKTYCLREYQSSIKTSVQSLLTAEASRLELSGFESRGTSMLYDGSEVFEFAGLARNVDSIKSAHGFGRYWVEEAQFISAESLETLTPTARRAPNKGLPKQFRGMLDDVSHEELEAVSIVFVANPGSRADPFSQRFIVPFEDAINRQGYYEDDLHLVVRVNYTDNPWFAESGLEEERKFDKQYKSKARYNHVWLGDYNDEIENSIIPAEWFDAAIDAHIKLGWKPQGAKFVSFDPSDRGDDAKGLAYRHGNVFLDIRERNYGEAYEACDWACEYAREVDADYFNWDADGMGALLRRHVAQQLNGTRTEYVEYKGSASPANPKSVYDPKATGGKPQKNEDLFRNQRSQWYINMADMFYNTYRAVVHGDYVDPDDMISLSSSIKCLDQVRAEVCRIPLKPNNGGYLQIMSKQDMKNVHQIDSPNMADSMKMTLAFNTAKRRDRKKVRIPTRPRQSMSRYA